MLRAVTVFLLLIGGPGRAAEPGAYAQVDVAPCRTSIYIGVVSLELPTLTRTATTYSAPYSAKVFPYFFASESGTLSVDLSDAELAQLAHGAAIDFHGRGVRSDGAERRVEGRATPTDAQSGKLKVRVFVSERIQLIFNTTYRFR